MFVASHTFYIPIVGISYTAANPVMEALLLQRLLKGHWDCILGEV